jgi:hypothetical protein
VHRRHERRHESLDFEEARGKLLVADTTQAAIAHKARQHGDERLLA